MLDRHDSRRTRARARGTFLASARAAAGITQRELGSRIGVTPQMVSAAETGIVLVGVDYTLRVLDACGLPETWQPENA